MAERGVSMSIMLSLLGIVIAAAGIAAIGFGIPINEFTLGTTLIVAGVSALTGGLILIGLAAVVAELSRLAEAGRTRIAVRPEARPTEAPEAKPPPSPLAVPPAPLVALAVPQRRGACSGAAPSCRGCGARAQGVAGRSWRGRGLEGVAPGFSVPIEADAPRIPTRKFRRRMVGGRPSRQAGRIRTFAGIRNGSDPARSSSAGAKSPAGARDARRATGRSRDPEVRRRRRHALYALYRRIHRGQVTGRNGQVRFDRRLARAYRTQLVASDGSETATLRAPSP